MKYFQKLIGEKVYLSPVNPEDAEIFAKWNNDPRITDGTHGTPRMITLKIQKEYLEDASTKSDSYQFAIVKKDNDNPIGILGLHKVNGINKTATLGIMIGEIDEHNKGYGTDAITTLLEFAFNTLNLYNVYLDVKSFNKKAIACYKKCGFKEIGTRHHCEYCNGERYDLIFMEVLKSDREKLSK